MLNQKDKLDGIVIGLFVGIDKSGGALVAFADNPKVTAMRARSTIEISGSDIGKEIALLFENGDLQRPLIIGFIKHPENDRNKENEQALNSLIKNDEIVLTAKKNLTFICGKSSITLTKSGKILIRGSYVLSRSSGVNKIKGGTVQIN